jgi:hypothetical protein
LSLLRTYIVASDDGVEELNPADEDEEGHKGVEEEGP